MAAKRLVGVVVLLVCGSCLRESAAVPAKLNAPLVAAGDVHGFSISPDASRVIYFADQNGDEIKEVFSVPIAGGLATRLNGTLVNNGDVVDYRWSPDGSRVFYRADQDADEMFELHAVPSSGGVPQKLNAALPVGRDIDSFRISADGGRVVYEADQDVDEVHELYSVASAGGAATKLNGPLVAGGDVNGTSFSPDGSRVLYVADQEVDGRFEIYSVPSIGGTPQKLNGMFQAFSNLSLKGWQFSPDGSRVVYLADQDSDEVYEAYSVPSGGGQAVKLNGTLVPGGDVSYVDLQFSPAGDRVFYQADQDANDVFEVYSVLSSGGTPVKLNGPPLPAGGQGAGIVEVSPSGDLVLYLADQDVNNVVELFCVPSVGGTPVKLNGPLVAVGDVGSADFSPDGQYVLYRADQEVDERLELYVVPRTGGTPVKLNGSLVAGGDVFSAGGVFTPDSSRVTYLADQEVNDVVELYVVPVSGGLPTKVNAPLVTGGGVANWQISPDGRFVVYLADQDSDEVFELYSFALVGEVPGDFNGDGRVDAADYTVWRDGLGSQYSPAEYSVWKTNFGTGAGSSSAGAAPLDAAVPEPASWVLVAIAGINWRGRRRQRPGSGTTRLAERV